MSGFPGWGLSAGLTTLPLKNVLFRILRTRLGLDLMEKDMETETWNSLLELGTYEHFTIPELYKV
jgi:hypothetical protein